MSLIDELGIIALASRLERLSEVLKKDASRVYKENNFGKYKWYPVLYVIEKSAPIGVGELASELSYAHPSVIQTLAELEKEKLIKSITDKSDSRKRLISLTAKGRELIVSMMPLFESFKKALIELTSTQHNLVQALKEVEENLAEKSFYNRIKMDLKTRH